MVKIQADVCAKLDLLSLKPDTTRFTKKYSIHLVR